MSGRCFFFFFSFCYLFLVLTSKLFAVGAWYSSGDQVLRAAQVKRSFHPDFAIVKWGVFSTSGKLKLHSTGQPSLEKSRCPVKKGSQDAGDPMAWVAWVTHRLSSGERLSEAAGKQLGMELAKSLQGTCFSSVELDIEILLQAEPWLGPFLKAVRLQLPAEVLLRLAVPVISPQKIPGRYWELREAVKAIEWVDGLDVMAYDSGVKTSQQYSEVFKNLFFFVMELMRQAPGKTIVLGLPAYGDKTTLHSPEVENLKTVLETLKPFTPFQLKPLCEGHLRFAYYAGWTLSAQDTEVHFQLEEWKNAACQKK